MSHLAALAPGDPCLFGSEFVGRPLLVSGLSALAGDLPLLLPIHARKATSAFLCHDNDPFWELKVRMIRPSHRPALDRAASAASGRFGAGPAAHRLRKW